MAAAPSPSPIPGGGSPLDQPVIPPPPGKTVNLVDPPSITKEVYITTCVLLSLSLVMIILRIYTRWRLKGMVGIDDYTIVLGFILGAVNAGTSIRMGMLGMGVHIWDIKLGTYLEFWKVCQATTIVYSATILAIKLSFLFLYLRLFPREYRSFYVWWWAILVVVVGYGVAGIFVPIFACIPTDKVSKCAVQLPVFLTCHAVLHVVTDLALLVLPIPIVWRLNFKRKQKIIVSLIFTLGSFTCVISLYRLSTNIRIMKAGQMDITYTSTAMTLWSIIEINSAIICACAMTLRPLIPRHFSRLFPSHGVSTTEPYNRNSHEGRSRKSSSRRPRSMNRRFSRWGFSHDSHLERGSDEIKLDTFRPEDYLHHSTRVVSNNDSSNALNPPSTPDTQDSVLPNSSQECCSNEIMVTNSILVSSDKGQRSEQP